MNKEKINILIAHKSPIMRAAMQKSLTAHGYTSTFTAESGEQVFDVLQTHAMALAIIDSDLGGRPGIEVMQSMKDAETTSHVALIFIVGKDDKTTISQAMLIGVSALLLKPFTQDLFIDVVNQALTEMCISHDPQSQTPGPQSPLAACADDTLGADVPQAPAATGGIFQGLSVMVVDDSSSMLHILTEYLTKIGFGDITAAKDGAKAWDILQTGKKLDLIISDWKMPYLSGIELLDKVRSAYATPSIPFVMVTSEAKTENILLAGKHSATAYLVKPFSYAELLGTIRDIFQDKPAAPRA